MGQVPSSWFYTQGTETRWLTEEASRVSFPALNLPVWTPHHEAIWTQLSPGQSFPPPLEVLQHQGPAVFQKVCVCQLLGRYLIRVSPSLL